MHQMILQRKQTLHTIVDCDIVTNKVVKAPDTFFFPSDFDSLRTFWTIFIKTYPPPQNTKIFKPCPGQVIFKNWPKYHWHIDSWNNKTFTFFYAPKNRRDHKSTGVTTGSISWVLKPQLILLSSCTSIYFRKFDTIIFSWEYIYLFLIFKLKKNQ